MSQPVRLGLRAISRTASVSRWWQIEPIPASPLNLVSGPAPVPVWAKTSILLKTGFRRTCLTCAEHFNRPM